MINEINTLQTAETIKFVKTNWKKIMRIKK